MTYDVAVVGGGPAGSSAARAASSLGLSTILLDSAEFPRNKPCGGAISEQAQSYLGFPVPESLYESNVFGARVHFEGRTVVARLADRLAVIVSRSRFDHLLLEKAEQSGAEVRQGIRVSEVEVKNDEVEVVTESLMIRARYCIVAAGASTRLGRTVREPLTKDEYAVAVEMDVPAPDEEVSRFADGLIDIYFGVARMGYGWVFPHQSWFNVGLAGIASKMDRPRGQLEEFAHTLPTQIASRLEQAENRVGASIPAGGLNRPVASGRVLLAGDSAGFVDSFYGEGIAYAIRSGQLAATCIASGGEVAARYSRQCDREIVRPLKHSYVLAQLLDRYPNFLMRVFASHPIALQRFLEVPARRLAYSDFLRWFLVRAPYFLLTA